MRLIKLNTDLEENLGEWEPLREEDFEEEDQMTIFDFILEEEKEGD